MMYSSLKFIIFSIAVVLGYYLIPKRGRPFFIISINAYFCALLGIKHLAVLFGSTLLSYVCAFLIQKYHSRRLMYVSIGMIVFALFMTKFGTVFGFDSILIPAGYSFYALQMISFLYDVHYAKIKSFSFIEYVQYMTFFPILLQGPICRFEYMQKEFKKNSSFQFERVKAGALLVLFGLFKKLVIADRLNLFVTDVFNHYEDKSGGILLCAVLFYAFQLYSDFSGCTDISRGVSECLDIKLPLNFRNPYFSLSIKEFWNRWHLSLSSWLKDYVYIPLGGNRKGVLRKYLNLLITFFVSGLWHGTGLQYLVWGCLQALGQIAESIAEQHFLWLKNTRHIGVRLIKRIYVSAFVLGSWLVFRAHGVKAAVLIAFRICTNFFSFSGLYSCGLDQKDFVLSLILIIGLVCCDLIREKKSEVRQCINQSSYFIKCCVFMILIFGILVFGMYGSGYNAADFIYMQF